MKLITKLAVFSFVLSLAAMPIAANAQTQSTTPTKKDKTTQSHTDKTNAAEPKMDINTASVSELAKLPGIDSATARKIVDGRPYVAKNQLKSRGIISDETYLKIKEKIIAKHAKSDSDSRSKTGSKTDRKKKATN